MVAHKVPVSDHLFHEIRRGFQIMPHHEEGGRHIVLFERIQDRLCVPVFIPCIKGQVDHFFRAVAHVMGVVLLQLLRGGVSGGLAALLPETESPVCA